MNPVIETILKRKSVRAYEKKAIEAGSAGGTAACHLARPHRREPDVVFDRRGD